MSFGAIEVSLWLDQPRYDTLQRILRESGTDLETVMQARLEEFYRQTVPDFEQLKINNMMEAERLAEERQREADMKLSVFRIVEDGQNFCFIAEKPMEFLEMAYHLRQYLRCSLATKPKQFVDCLPVYKWLSENQFQDFAQERMVNPERVVGVFNVDLDKGEVALVDSFQGWRNYRMKDVSNAVYSALSKRWASEDERWRKLYDHLNGREIPFQQGNSSTMQMM